VRFEWAAAPSLVGGEGRVEAAFAAGAALITMPGGAGANRIVDQWLAASGAEVARRLTCNSMAAIAGLVVAGVGVSLFPESWLIHVAATGRLVRLAGDPELAPLRYYLHWRRDDSRPSIRRLRELVQTVADFSRPLSFLQEPAAPEPLRNPT
jgi:DNA-binding transcriptional LysR family regulator